MPDDLQQSLATINQKLDMFMAHYRDRHIELERRVDKVEIRVDAVESRINSLHEGSMDFVHKALAEQTAALNASTQALERRIFDKLEERSTSSRSHWLTIAIAIIGWLVALGGLLVAILKH